MKKIALLSALLIAAAGYVCLQPVTPPPDLATFMPGGALLYLQSPNFGGLLRDWNNSQVKADWLASANYQVFSRSNLFNKLHEVYGQYGEAAGFAPDLENTIPIAGTDSALALYQIRDVEFLYVTRLSETALAQSALWPLRDQFARREAGGVPFYLRSDPASHRTVAFAFTKGYLLLATRDDLVAQALELMAGGRNPSLASERWSQAVLAQAPNRGDVRLVMNLEALRNSTYFRTYWIQRNASVLRRYWAGVADVHRQPTAITETRVFLRTPDSPEAATQGETAPISGLLALVPPRAGIYKIAPISDPSAAAQLIVNKLIASLPQGASNPLYAPNAAMPDARAGTEADLETRIDQEPLPPDAGLADSTTAIRTLLQKAGAQTVLWMQSTAPVSGTFLAMPSAAVLAAPTDWDAAAVRAALSDAAGKLWTTSQLGASWSAATAGRHPLERLNGLGKLMFTSRGKLLFVGNDADLLGSILDRAAGSAPPATILTYAAGFRHLLERPPFERMMAALDFGSPRSGFGNMAGGREPSFFSGNIASLSRTLARVAEVRVTEQEKGAATLQTVVYQLGQ